MPFKLSRGPRLVSDTGSDAGAWSWETQTSLPDSVKRIKPTVNVFGASTPRTVIESTNSIVRYPAFVFPQNSMYKTINGNLSVGRESTFSWTSELAQARSQLRGKVKAQNVNLAQAMAEYRSTTALFWSLARDLHSGYRRLRMGNIYGVYRSSPTKIKELSKRWIELQFGLVPVVSDLQGLCDSLALGLRTGQEMHITTYAGPFSKTLSRSYQDPAGNGKIEHYERELFEVRLKAQYIIQNAEVHDVSRFGFLNAANLAWELIPFSFVVDWAFGVGSWLSNLDALHGVSSFQYVQGTRTHWTGQNTATNGGMSAHATYTTKARTQAVSNLPIGLPLYKPSTSLKTVLNGMALLSLLHKEK